MRRSWYMLTFIVLIGSCANEKEQYRPELSTLTESVYASVSVQPEGLYQAYSTTTGILDKIYVEEGDTVSQGQSLFKLVSRNTEIASNNAQLSADLARENYLGNANLISSQKMEIATLSEQVRLDSLNYYRQKRLWDKKIGSLSDLENRKLKFDAGRNNLSNLKRALQRTENELKTGLKQSQNAVLSAESNLDDYLIKSRLDGKVYEVLKEEGELVNQQTALAKIGKRDSFILEMLIDEIDIARIEIGQITLVMLDAYPGRVFKAEIMKIHPIKDERNQTFTIEGRFIERPDALYAGLSGEANILISEKKNVLTLPIEYLLEGDKVRTQEGDIHVKVGMRTIDRVEILEGLDTSSVILKP